MLQTAIRFPDDDPETIAEYLVQTHGLEEARKIAFEGTQAEHALGDFYRLSIWREVRRMLRDWPASDVSAIESDGA